MTVPGIGAASFLEDFKGPGLHQEWKCIDAFTGAPAPLKCSPKGMGTSLVACNSALLRYRVHNTVVVQGTNLRRFVSNYIIGTCARNF